MHTRARTYQRHSKKDVAYATSLFFAVRRIMRTALAQNMKFDTSTWPRIEAMKFIADNDKSKMKDIATYLSIAAPSATSLVGGLVKSGLVVCKRDRADRRASVLLLSKKGKTELTKTTARGLEVFTTLFSVLSSADMKAFTRALERIKEEAVPYT